MPQAIPLALGIASIAVKSTAFSMILALAGAMANLIISGSDRSPSSSYDSQESTGTLVNTCDTQAPLRLVYGTARVGINRVFAGVSGADNKYLHLVGTVGEGEVQGIHQEAGVDQLFLNDELYTEYDDTVYYEFFTGTATQNVCSTLQSAIPEWNDPLRYTAYLYIRLKYDRDVYQSVPSITLVIDGLKAYNPSTETTEFTTNPGLSSRDYITRSGRRGGMGFSPSRLLDSTFTASAAYCTAKGWTIGLPLSDGNKVAADNLKEILSTFRGALIYSENQYKLKYRDLNYESPVMDLDEKDIIESDESSLTIAQPSIFGTPNAVRMKFLNRDLNYQLDDYVMTDAAALSSDGYHREEEISILGVNSYANIMKMANYWLERLRINKTVSSSARARCIVLEPFDLIRLTHSLPGWENKILRITSPCLNEDGTVGLQAEEEDNDFYNDTYDMETHSFYDTNLPGPATAVASVINVSHAEEVYYYRGRSFTRWKIDFDAPAAETYPFWDYAEIWVKIGTGDWKFMTKSTGDYMLDPVEEGELYTCRMVSVSIFGTKQNFEDGYTVSKTILGKTTLPGSLASLTAVASDDVVNLYATPLSEPDIEGYEVRLGSAWNGALFVGFNESPNLRLAGVRPGTHTFWMAAKDNAGNYSETPRSATVTVFYPANYAQKNSWSWDFTTGTHNNTEHATYDSEDCLKCSHTSSVLTGTWTSPEYNLGSKKKVRIWGDFRTSFVAGGNTWDGVIPAGVTWDDVLPAGMTWTEFFSNVTAGNIQATIKWGDASGSLANEADYFHILAPEIEGQYVQIEVTITDPASDANLYLRELNMLAYFWE